MCDLITRLQEFIDYERQHGVIIDLTYQWRWRGEQQNADDAERSFNKFNRRISSAIKTRNRDAIDETIGDILSWGGIYGLGRQRRNIYVDYILNGIENGAEINPNTLLSSWTKILTAYNPEKYSIYDSRVAISLSVIVCDYPWFLPPKRDMSVIRYLRSHCNQRESPAVSYNRYLELLPKGRKSEYEKKLFMLGGQIDVDMARNWLNRH